VAWFGVWLGVWCGAGVRCCAGCGCKGAGLSQSKGLVFGVRFGAGARVRC